jgi:uncharacterized protein YdeI (YjbR/CyaY-like superfamily)
MKTDRLNKDVAKTPLIGRAAPTEKGIVNDAKRPDSMPVVQFKSSAEFRKWLQKNHAKSAGIWLRFFKKDSGQESIRYAEALDQALCFGWIDSQAKPFDESSWLQKYTPRRQRSGWSKRNTEHVERLTKSGAMTTAGLKEVTAAKADGRWQAAYASPRNASVPKEFLDALRPEAMTFFKTLNKANVYAIAYRLQTAKKPETREKRMKEIIAMMEQGKKFHT